MYTKVKAIFFIYNSKDMWIWLYLLNYSSVASFQVPQVNMFPCGDIKDVPGSCDGISGFFIVWSSCAIFPFTKPYCTGL